ncbi:MAG: flavodoxin family protein [Promethearchaeota archaeon]
MKSLIVLYSYHHRDTEKLAKVFVKILNGQIITSQQINPEELQGYDLIGFGSGIYSGKHHRFLLDLADKLIHVINGRAFLFSTCTFKREVAKNHSVLREKLQSKGFVISGEFGFRGFNTNSFIKYVGGVNKGRPNVEDLNDAELFIQNLKQSLE